MDDFAADLHRQWSVQRPDVVHAHFWMSGLAAAPAARAAGVPLVQTFHALGVVKRRHQKDRDTSPASRIEQESRLCRAVDHVVATGRDEVDELVAMGMDPAHATIVPCGVDTDLFTPGRVRAGGPARLLVVGRLVERKGVADVVTALADLPGVELFVAGGPREDGLALDPEACRLRELATRNGTAERVHLLGSRSREQLAGLIRSADVVVAVPWYEPFGIVPLEAMACARPVVGSAVGGLLDTVVPGVCGELVPPRRPDRLADVLRGLLGDPARRAVYGAGGLQRVRARYGWERVSERTERVYERVLARTEERTVEVAR